MMQRAEIIVRGIVQGVGFRPFTFRLATRLNLKGFVRNMGDAGVQVVVEGDKETIEKFIDSIRKERPPLSRVDDIAVSWKPYTGEFDDFRVISSDRAKLGLPSVIPPDLALCDDCLREMLDKNDRRYLYPFITCVNCGPRFTIIESLPYDRENTSMREFPLCPDCLREYHDPADRRYRAEPTCCPACGPKMVLHSADGSTVDTEDPIGESARLLDEGHIVAVKGIGGIHIACMTTEDGPVARLRRAFNRPHQPFAVMSRDLETVEGFAEVTPQEAELLTSYRRPIVLLRKGPNYSLSELISPGLDTVGVMLPYSGIHHLLLRRCRGPAYVMTSANPSGLPMITDNHEALSKLSKKVDYLLLHNRRIVSRCDDSVLKVVDGRTAFLRRSRGYVPEPVDLRFTSKRTVLALGADFNVTASVLTGSRCFVSQHIGDTEHLETLEYLRSASTHLLSLLGIERPDIIAHDLHPRYSTTRLAEKMGKEAGIRTIGIQHHHAHLCALMAEHGIEELVGVAADGIGYGDDGTAWGGEVMIADMKSYRRVGGLKTQRMPGGDLAAVYPARMVAGILWGAMKADEVREVLRERCGRWMKRGEIEIDAVVRQLERGLNVHMTSSCGRVLDAISCVLGICGHRTYEGEPAMKLEAAAASGDPDEVGLEPRMVSEDGRPVVDTTVLLMDVLDAMLAGHPIRHIAASAQNAVAKGLAEIAIETAEGCGIREVGCSGGVFYNRMITRILREEVERAGLRFFRHELLPCGDGCISVGQAASAACRSGEDLE